MNINDIIFAATCKDRPGFCHVTYCDGTTDIIASGIGELYESLCQRKSQQIITKWICMWLRTILQQNVSSRSGRVEVK
jgi:hypothetical protein